LWDYCQWVYNRYVPKMRKSAPAAAALIPIWFQFSSRFYRRLAAIANECNLDPADVVKRGMRLVLQQQRDRSTQVLQKTPAGLSIYRWRNIPAEERSRMSREMARKRWDRANKTKRG
jgi:hypothetical protein